MFHLKSVPRFLTVLLVLIIYYSCQPRTGQTTKQVESGLDHVVATGFKQFAGQRVGLICNHTARDKQGRHVADLFHKNAQCELRAIFAPEHGFRGEESGGKQIQDNIDVKTGAPIFSLYGKLRKPTPEMLQNIDVLVYDIQDVGVRFYTYISTMSYAMEAAAEHPIPFVVLDRPNPIRGDRVEGARLDPQYRSFVGMHPIPVRYGLTCGELAILINQEGYLKDDVQVDLSVVEINGWDRELWYDQTDLPWIAPSPNMPDLQTAIVYPGMCFLEGVNISEGRGTDLPFLAFGAPWIVADELLVKMEALDLAGVAFETVTFTPKNMPERALHPKYEDQRCQGLRLRVTDRNKFEPIPMTVWLLAQIKQLYPQDFQFYQRRIDLLSGSSELRETLDQDGSVAEMLDHWAQEAAAFAKSAKQYYLY